MWQIVRQFFIVLHFALGDPMIGHALPQNRILRDGIRQLANTAENSLISNVKLKLNLSNASSTGKPTMLTVSTFSNWDSRTTILKSSLSNPTSEDILKASYDKPVIYPTSGPAKMNISTRKGGPSSTVRTRAPFEMKPCRKIVAKVLCEDDVGDYPLEAARALSRDDKFKSLYAPYFGNELTRKDVPEINTRVDSNPKSNQGLPLCSIRENFKFYRPTKLMDKNNNWRYILQNELNNLTQMIRTEVCVNPDGRCHLLNTLDMSYESWCVQKYSFRKLLWVMDDSKHGIDEFQVPSCCSCRYNRLQDEYDSGALRITGNNKHNQKSVGSTNQPVT